MPELLLTVTETDAMALCTDWLVDRPAKVKGIVIVNWPPKL